MGIVTKFPMVKKNLTAAEFFRELADYAEENPELFSHYVAIWEPLLGVEDSLDLAGSENLTLAILNTMLDMAKINTLAGEYCRED